MVGAASHAYGWLRDGILEGRLPSDLRLREEELAEAIGCSRTPVREAIRRLAAQGLVEIVPNRGAYVAAWSSQDLFELFEMRGILESHAARLAASHITTDALDQLTGLADEMEYLADHGNEQLDRLSDLNGEFHAIVVRSSLNSRLNHLVSGLVQIPIVYRTFRHYNEGELRRSMQHHRELIAALRRGDGEWAAATMLTHILSARSTLLGESAAGRLSD